MNVFGQNERPFVKIDYRTSKLGSVLTWVGKVFHYKEKLWPFREIRRLGGQKMRKKKERKISNRKRKGRKEEREEKIDD